MESHFVSQITALLLLIILLLLLLNYPIMKLNAEMMETEGAAAHRRRVCVLPSSRYL